MIRPPGPSGHDTISDETLAFDLIKDVGPGGNFVTAKHTRRFMRKEHYQPTLSDRDHREEWEDKGSKTTWQRAAEAAGAILAKEKNGGLPPETKRRILSEIKDIVD